MTLPVGFRRQTKGCDSYGKSIPRDKVESDVGNLIKTLQPTQKLLELAKAMFRHAWDQRLAQARAALQTGQRQIKEIDTLLTRIMDATNARVTHTYEDNIGELEKAKALTTAQLEKQAEPKGSYEEKLEPVLTFLANPWKLWETGEISLRRTVLKLALADRLKHHRNEGPGTAKIALPFKALGGLQTKDVCFGAQERTRTSTSIQTLAPEASASTNSATWAGVVRGQLYTPEG